MRGRAVCVAIVIGVVGCGTEGSDRNSESSIKTHARTPSSAYTSQSIPRANTTAVAPHPRFFFYFDRQKPARSAARELRAYGYAVRTTAPDGRIAQWSVIATGEPLAPDIATAEDAFEPWSAARGGEYDGNEVPVNTGHPELPVIAP